MFSRVLFFPFKIDQYYSQWVLISAISALLASYAKVNIPYNLQHYRIYAYILYSYNCSCRRFFNLGRSLAKMLLF